MTYRALCFSAFRPKKTLSFLGDFSNPKGQSFAMFFQVLYKTPRNFRCKYRPTFNNVSFLTKSFSRIPFTEPQMGLTSRQDSRSSKGSSCSRQLWSLSLKLTWGTGTHKTATQGSLIAIRWCFPHLETSTWAFSVVDNGSCCVQHSQRAEAAGPGSADVSFQAETSLTAGGLRGKHLSDTTPASKLELQAHKHLPNTPVTATHCQKLPTVNEKDNRKQMNWILKLLPLLSLPHDCNALVCGARNEMAQIPFPSEGKQRMVCFFKKS